MSEKEDDGKGREEEDAREAETAAPAAAPVGQAAAAFGLMRYVHAIFFGGAIALAWLLIQIVDTAWTRLNLGFAWMPAPRGWMTIAIGGIAGFGTAIYMWRHPKLNRLAVEVVTELSKVTWPTRKELSASTVVVIVVSIIASIILGVFDMFWAWATEQLLNI
ncbi:MAG: preprotein translocase subunit SecE [Proteobacteria bacterium]|jgi:preprotein translocase subunit SecE|nr:preprotein translocase subunit SecE [Pseudomonadota bacterium]